ncbi:hypothetical protein L21SP3_02169 [Sedimentisphaera cyanobacteriorum]|uniref:SbsA Ig-like domain-containing protein n=1 Tax=Sedimentisphaera cyanobacteriorum TaxID=1940790 RepID=A0A1Q2HSA1_9BACT|nr:hypothetical protein [Sedimentisphaera cyanobacteriorum]AQQ10337.1 hypothetical protein L21SP3_02169 [Sedimentisphaera cyanobacteriorum]
MKSLLFTALLLLAAAQCFSEIVGGSVTVISPPLNTGEDNHQVDELLGFNERQHATLQSDLELDFPASVIPSGATVSSHYIIYDPEDQSRIAGTVVTDELVAGLIYDTEKLNASDFLGLPGTNYLNPYMRGLESGDSAVIDESYTVSFDLGASTPGDYARIITASEPAVLGPQLLMRNPKAAVNGVHTNESGVGSVRLLFNEPIIFGADEASVENEDEVSISSQTTGSGSRFMIITFSEALLGDEYTITVPDTVTSKQTGNPMDGDNDGSAGGDLVFTIEHRKRQDFNNDNEVGIKDLAKFADEWLWAD